MQVYELHPDHNAYKTIASVERRLFGSLFKGEPMGETWESVQMRLLDEGKKKLKRGDFPGHPIAPFFSRKAVDALKDILEPAGELLPVQCEDEVYYAYNVLNIVDAIDIGSSEVELFSDGTIMRFKRYVFTPAALEGQFVFKIPPWKHASTIFVTDSFKRRIEEAGLAGFKLELLWDENIQGQTTDIPKQ